MGKFADELKFPDMPQEPSLDDFTPHSIGWLIQRYIEKTDAKGMKHLGESHRYALIRLERDPLAKRIAEKLKKSDVSDFAERRRQTVAASTVLQDLTFITCAIRYCVARWDDCEPAAAALAVIKAAKPTLLQQQLIGKSRPRDRRPTGGEWQQLIEYFRQRAHEPRVKIPMAEIQEFQVCSARRISETCRIKCIDVDQAKRTVIVRDMKDPKQKKGNDVEVPLLGRAWDLVEARLKHWDGVDPNARVWPYYHKSVGAAFTLAKAALKIKNLHLHDLRREAASRLFEAGYDVQEVMLVTGHKTPQMLLRVYTKLKPEDLKFGPAKMRGLKADHTYVLDTSHDLNVDLPRAVPQSERRVTG
jgi:integrase